jgi:hypothetical protein
VRGKKVRRGDSLRGGRAARVSYNKQSYLLGLKHFTDPTLLVTVAHPLRDNSVLLTCGFLFWVNVVVNIIGRGFNVFDKDLDVCQHEYFKMMRN